MIPAKHIFVIFVLAICTLEFINSVKVESSETAFAKNLNGKKSSNSTSGIKRFSKKPFIRLTAIKIIVFILTIILSGIFIYYFFLFYPILCRKERNYDVVEHSRDTTPTPNTEKVQNFLIFVRFQLNELSVIVPILLYT